MDGPLDSTLSAAEIELLVPKVGGNLCIGYKFDENTKSYEVTSIDDNVKSSTKNKVNIGDYIIAIWNISVDKCTFAQFQDIVGKSGCVVLLKFRQANHASGSDQLKMEEVSSSSSLNTLDVIDDSRLIPSSSGKQAEDVPNIISTLSAKHVSNAWDNRWYCLGGDGLGNSGIFLPDYCVNTSL